MKYGYVVYDSNDKTYEGKAKAGWTNDLQQAKVFYNQDNAQRHCYLDTMVVVSVVIEVVETVRLA